MKEKIKGIGTALKRTTQSAARDVTVIAEHENTKAVVGWARGAAATAAREAAELGRRAARSEMAKDAATGAAIGAAIAVPLPVIGPAIGAAVGAGVGVFVNLKAGRAEGRPTSIRPGNGTHLPSGDLHKELTDLDDLRQKGILSQDEFDVEKSKILSRR